MSIKVTLEGRKQTIRETRKNLNTEFELKKELKKRQMISALRAATPIDTGKARAGWESTPSGIENPVKYIDRLNKGSSKQAPSYFIERTLLLQKDVIPSGIIVRSK